MARISGGRSCDPARYLNAEVVALRVAETALKNDIDEKRYSLPHRENCAIAPSNVTKSSKDIEIINLLDKRIHVYGRAIGHDTNFYREQSRMA